MIGPLLLLAAWPALAAARVPSVRYQIVYAPERDTGKWEVSATVSGLAPEPELSVRLPAWGDWAAFGEDYVSGFKAYEVVEASGDAVSGWRLRLVTPRPKELHLVYSVRALSAGESARAAYPLLPSCAGSWCRGFAGNVLVELRQGDKPVRAVRTLTFALPDGWSAATGWGRPKTPRDAVRLDDGYENGVIAFGSGARTRSAGGPGARYEVVQNGLAGDVTQEALAAARDADRLLDARLRPSLARTTRLLISGVGGPAVATAHGIELGIARDDLVAAPAVQHGLARELVRQRLGMLVRGGREPAWFTEGFSDYLAAWILVHLRRVPEGWFADEMAARERAVASNPASYERGTLLAFAMDLRLREGAGGGLFTFLRDLRGPSSQAELVDRIGARGFDDLAKRYILAPEPLAETSVALNGLGYQQVLATATVAYLGLDVGGPSRSTVLAVDAAGPAAAAGIRAGDVLVRYVQTRRDGVRVGISSRNRFRFGTDLFDPDEPAVLTVVRDGRESRVAVEPMPAPWGLVDAYRGSRAAERGASFFK